MIFAKIREIFNNERYVVLRLLRTKDQRLTAKDQLSKMLQHNNFLFR